MPRKSPTPGLVRPSEGSSNLLAAVCGWFTEVFETLLLWTCGGSELIASTHATLRRCPKGLTTKCKKQIPHFERHRGRELLFLFAF